MKSGQSFALKPAASTMYEALLAEFFFTLVLAFVVLSVATSRQALSEYFGFAIGMCVTVGGFAIGKLSGGSLNSGVSPSGHECRGSVLYGRTSRRSCRGGTLPSN